ncbi:GLI2 isoform 10, partial [Pongo abelii]
ASEKQEAKSGILEAAGFPDPGKKASPLVVAAAAAAAVAAQGVPQHLLPPFHVSLPIDMRHQEGRYHYEPHSVHGVHGVPFLQPASDAPPEPQAGTVHLPTLRCQPGPAADDPHLTQLASGLHQQLPKQLGGQRFLWASVSRCPQPSLHLPPPHQPRGLPADSEPAEGSGVSLWTHT